MRKRTALLLAACLLSLCLLSGCTQASISVPGAEPSLSQIRSICSLATLECYYHNVAKSVKPAGEGFFHIGECDRDFWLEYSGIVTVGVDMSRVNMVRQGNELRISMPKAKILSIQVDSASLSEESIICSSDNWPNGNPITASDQTAAVRSAQNDMRSAVENNSSLLLSAQDRACSLIESYISRVSELAGTNYTIIWQAA